MLKEGRRLEAGKVHLQQRKQREECEMEQVLHSSMAEVVKPRRGLLQYESSPAVTCEWSNSDLRVYVSTTEESSCVPPPLPFLNWLETQF